MLTTEKTASKWYPNVKDTLILPKVYNSVKVWRNMSDKDYEMCCLHSFSKSSKH